MQIKSIHAREILDSRGFPTVETTVELENGFFGRSSVPSGASTGSHEAVELRDADPHRFLGKGVLKAVGNVNDTIAKAVKGMSVEDLESLDKKMIEVDGTDNKGNLGANAILSVSEAALKAASASAKQPLYEYVFRTYQLQPDSYRLPQPTFNVINGGKHGNGKLEFQEFHILPRTNQSFAEMLRMGDEVYLHLKKLLEDGKVFQGVGDEGGYTGDFLTNLDAIDWMLKAIEKAGYVFKQDLHLGLDVAASEFYKEDGYHLADKANPLSAEQMVDYMLELAQEYSFVYLEDPLHEDDWEHWQKITEKLATSQTPVIGDDFLTTNPQRVVQAIEGLNCSAVLVKPNQIGTVTETLEVIRLAKQANWKIVLSHRSGETNDHFIADFAVGVGADFVKFGAPARGERVAKYNRLMEIEEEIG